MPSHSIPRSPLLVVSSNHSFKVLDLIPKVIVLLANIRCAATGTIPPQHADLVTSPAICPCSSYLFGDRLASHSNWYMYIDVYRPVTTVTPWSPPVNINVAVPSGHELGQYSGFIDVQPSKESRAHSNFYLYMYRSVSVFSHWGATSVWIELSCQWQMSECHLQVIHKICRPWLSSWLGHHWRQYCANSG